MTPKQLQRQLEHQKHLTNFYRTLWETELTKNDELEDRILALEKAPPQVLEDFPADPVVRDATLRMLRHQVSVLSAKLDTLTQEGT
jgi:phage I-like protein